MAREHDTAVLERRVAPVHECPRCRSRRVAIVVVPKERYAIGRCRRCEVDIPLIPAGFAC